MHPFRLVSSRRMPATLSLLGFAAIAAGQGANYPYVLKTFAGTFPLGDGGPATQALLFSPTAVAVDASANVYVLDSLNYRIRKITPNGTIGTLAPLSAIGTDMKLGSDGSLYVAAPGLVLKVSPTGAVTTLAGNGTQGFGGDGGPAVNALVSAAEGIALDSAGNIFFGDSTRIREITLDGNIKTVAGTGTGGYDGDNKPALSARINGPLALAFDGSNTLYFADAFNYRVRKITPNGMITTIAGNGIGAAPVEGPATATPMGVPHAVTVDGSSTVYIGDVSAGLVLKVTPDGNLTKAAGSSTFGYADGPANSTYIANILGLGVDASGNVFIVDNGSQRIRELSGGNVRTIVGRLHYSGDGGPATAALLHGPSDTAIDAQGNVFILDANNYRIREVTPDGIIHTFVGAGLAGPPAEGSQAVSATLPLLTAMAMDGLGDFFVATSQRLYKISAAGTIATLAGGAGAVSGSGDGGPANKAGLAFVYYMAADSAGNVYVSEAGIPRIRKISASDGTISTFAGSATAGYTGDGGPATSARINAFAPLAVDRSGNVFFGDNTASVVRMVNQAGIVSTVAGNGTKGNPTDGAQAKASPLPNIGPMGVDTSGNLYFISGNNIYGVDHGGVIHLVSGGGKAAVADGLLANSTVGFSGKGVQADASGDLYVADFSAGGIVRKLVLNSPSGLAIADGNNQTAPAGSALPKPLKVIVNGRGGIAVPGVTVSFSVTSGTATLSASSVQTDSSGSAAVGVTLGSAAGNVVITAVIAGSTLAPVQFTVTATSLNPNCTVGVPVITSVKSLGDFGGFSTFGAGSWLEVKGSNLAVNTRLWGGDDFNGANAPASLDGSSVSINGNAGFVEYISATQINVQAPADPATGAVQVTVTNCAGTSAPSTVQKVAMAPGMLAPGSFNIGGRQYLVALFQDGVTFVGNTGLITGVPFRPAKPGESVTAYGIGFGPVTPPIAPGVVASAANSVSGLAISFGQTPAATSYAGLAPGNIGLYQFNITVPDVPDGDYQINVSVGGVQVAQTLYLTVHQ